MWGGKLSFPQVRLGLGWGWAGLGLGLVRLGFWLGLAWPRFDTAWIVVGLGLALGVVEI